MDVLKPGPNARALFIDVERHGYVADDVRALVEMRDADWSAENAAGCLLAVRQVYRGASPLRHVREMIEHRYAGRTATPR